MSASALIAVATPADAQELPIRRVEVAVGGGWFGGARLGSTDAGLRQNAAPPASLRLFAVDTRLAGAPALRVAAGVAMTRRWGLEGAVVLSHPVLRSSVSADAEGAPAITVGERINQYIFEGQVLVLLEQARFGMHTVPFATAGAGYVRQLHEGLTLIDDGYSVHIGAGVKHWLLARNHGRVRASGVRGEAQLYLLNGGVRVANGPSPHGAVSGSLFVAF